MATIGSYSRFSKWSCAEVTHEANSAAHKCGPTVRESAGQKWMWWSLHNRSNTQQPSLYYGEQLAAWYGRIFWESNNCSSMSLNNTIDMLAKHSRTTWISWGQNLPLCWCKMSCEPGLVARIDSSVTCSVTDLSINDRVAWCVPVPNNDGRVVSWRKFPVLCSLRPVALLFLLENKTPTRLSPPWINRHSQDNTSVKFWGQVKQLHLGSKQWCGVWQ
jgi:hypothetical protein